MEKTYIKYLNEFKTEIGSYFKENTWTKKNYDFFQAFFQKENLLNLKEKLKAIDQTKNQDWTKNEIWKVFIEMRTKIHSFSTPAFSGKRALGNFPNHSLKRYIDVFYYLKYGEMPINERVFKLLNREDELFLRGFGLSSLSEIIGQAFPNEFVFYNKRNKEALKFLGFDLAIPSNISEAEEFLLYNKSIQTILNDYKQVIYGNNASLFSKTTIHQEFDQFLNWIYSDKIYTSDSTHFQPIGKISKVKLRSYNRFKKNLEIDLTYPLGHKKAGKPLDKVCFIGQSGTGKTTLLNLIKNFTFLKNDKSEINLVEKDTVEIEYSYNDLNLIVYSNQNNQLECKISKNKKKQALTEYLSKPRLINFPANSVEQFKSYRKNDFTRLDNIDLEGIVDFSETELSKRMWKKILFEIDEYKREELKISLQLSDKLKKGQSLNEIQNEINNFQYNVQNPLEKYANFIDPLLQLFNLQIKREINSESINNFGFIEVEHKIGTKKDFDNTKISLGTHQILEKTASLYNIAPYNSIILIDEPENSLYPDVQKAFIEFITDEKWRDLETNKNCQFFFATHSPTIASAFDPWEIVELKINNSGEIELENYLKNALERHIENYKFYPKYLRWDKILTQIFDLPNDGNQERDKKIYELAELEENIKYLKQQGKTEEVALLFEKFKEIAEKLNWDFKNAML